MEISLLDWGGDGPVALLHHANGLCAGIWGLLAEQLRPHFRVIALDARGHGDTTAPPLTGGAYAWIEFVQDLVPLAEQLVKERGEPIALAIGNSFGGLVTAYAAALEPALFARIAMLDPVVLPPPHLMGEMIGRMSGSDSQALESRGNPLAKTARRRQEVWPSREVAQRVWSRKELYHHDLFVRDTGEIYAIVARRQSMPELHAVCPVQSDIVQVLTPAGELKWEVVRRRFCIR